jgi:MEMO1 family protein
MSLLGRRASAEQSVRRPAVAGTFYAGDSEALSREVDSLLGAVSEPTLEGRVLAMVSPHAGYHYSGQVAAHGYASLAGGAYRRVVVLSPCHLDSFRGASVFDGDAYETPSGTDSRRPGLCGTTGGLDAFRPNLRPGSSTRALLPR